MHATMAFQFSLASHLIRCAAQKKINIINLSMKENADKIHGQKKQSDVNAVRVQDCARIYNSNADCGFCCSVFSYFVSFFSFLLGSLPCFHPISYDCVDNLKFNIFITSNGEGTKNKTKYQIE